MSKKDFKLNIIGKRKIWYAVSILIILAGIVSFAIQGFNFGIDFTGGSYVQLTFYEGAAVEADGAEDAEAEEAAVEDEKENTAVTPIEVELADLREVVNQYVEKTPTIQFDETNTAYLIRTELTTEEEVQEMLDGIESEIGTYQIDRNELVGPTIGNELTQKAIIALALACALMLIYITVRFQFWFGVAAIITLLHDALVVLSVFSI